MWRDLTHDDGRPMGTRGRAALREAWEGERAAARTAQTSGDAAAEWHHLERAHILSQPMVGPHVRTHVSMLRYALRHHDKTEVRGQLVRLLVAAPGTLTKRYPVGNTGGANVSALAPMPIPEDLRGVLEAVTTAPSSA
jgi:hypothetical protein